jgi:putative endonuclease
MSCFSKSCPSDSAETEVADKRRKVMLDNKKISLLRALGDTGEDAVVAYLEKQGFKICARNYTVFGGEVDIIAHKGEVLAFVEVKARSKSYFNLSEVLLPAKQRKIIKAARAYIYKTYGRQGSLQEMIYRFDVALLELQDSSWNITYIPDAFTDMQGVL